MTTSPSSDQLPALRDAIKRQREALDPSTLNAASEQILQLCSDFIAQHEQVAFYAAVRGEMSPQNLLQLAQQQGKACHLPVLSTDKPNYLDFVRVTDQTAFHNNRFGIPEPIPTASTLTPAPQLDVVFLPLVAFDTQGNRLGMGAGYYDRTFAFRLEQTSTKPLLVGLAYEFQRIQKGLPKQPWDVPLDFVATESRLYECP